MYSIALGSLYRVDNRLCGAASAILCEQLFVSGYVWMTANRFIVAGVLLALVSIPALVTGLRKGRVHLRGPYGRMDRRRQPLRF